MAQHARAMTGIGRIAGGAYLGDQLGSRRSMGFPVNGRSLGRRQAGRRSLPRGKRLSARRGDEQRNYNCKRRGQGSARLPEDGNRAG